MTARISNNYGLLDQAEEDEIHKSRPYAIETKPFTRIASRLLQPTSLINQPPAHLPTPPPDGNTLDEEAAAKTADRQQIEEQRRIWREECMLDFAAFESSIVRIQLLHNSNEVERARYAAEKLKIQETMQRVRDNTTELHVQLEEAQNKLTLRKTYDQLADKILSNRMLKPREDQHVQLEKLNSEIAELEREKEQYAETWTERRNQFKRIVEEGKNMLRIIRDEKEEAERKEGMEGGDDVDDGEGSTVRGEISRMGTPKPDGAVTPMHKSNNGDESSSQLAVPKSQHGMSGSPAHTRSTDLSPVGPEEKDTHDTDMTNSEGEIEEGEADVDSDIGEAMVTE
ncbi:hypothetical protein EJ05DRAFT_541744 [Pseudovirgaria hyperparasitica]|uniref:Tho complex subunit 7 n=1 Tax=Pseudovirgaria hyperparasitica TaxID=470096 RepID=A0A6A6VWW5_9PEZI|nr:uncharacterized protein EJ05DRAFT_541744 [Pseudovirgaria hyperparasitica]KAF2753747.1 hypothetical protein EJ05DRAFT_541744 [Pseudovirgaria hyperparasitica]